MTTPPICHYSPLITTACHYLPYSPDSLFAICNYSLSAIQVFQKPKGHIVRLCVNTLCVKTLSLQHVNNIQNLSGILRLKFEKLSTHCRRKQNNDDLCQTEPHGQTNTNTYESLNELFKFSCKITGTVL